MAPGGLYFLEDLQTDYLRQYADDTVENRPVTWIVRLLEDMWMRENDMFARRPIPAYRIPGEVELYVFCFVWCMHLISLFRAHFCRSQSYPLPTSHVRL